MSRGNNHYSHVSIDDLSYSDGYCAISTTIRPITSVETTVKTSEFVTKSSVTTKKTTTKSKIVILTNNDKSNEWSSWSSCTATCGTDV